MSKFTHEQIEAALKAKSDPLSPGDVRRIADARRPVKKMIREFPDSWKKTRKRANLLFDLIEASATGKIDIPPDELRVAAGALIYMAEPLDIVPDDEVDGYADDAAVIRLAMQLTEKHVRNFCKLRNLDFESYQGDEEEESLDTD